MTNYQAKKNIFFNGNFEKNHPVVNNKTLIFRYRPRSVKEINEILELSKRNAWTQRYVHSESEVSPTKPTPPRTEKNKDEPIQQESAEPTMDTDPKMLIEPRLLAFQESFNNPLSSRSHSALATKNAVVANARSIIHACGYKDLRELYSGSGLTALQKHFTYLNDVKMLKERSKKNLLAGYIEFLNFLEFTDDLPYPPNKRLKFIAYLSNACSGFARGCKFDEKQRAVKLGEEMHKGLFPLFSEVDHVYQLMKDDSLFLINQEKPIDLCNFRTFVSFISFGLMRRCVIRPGALLLMTIAEFKNPNHIDDDTYLIHVREQKAATYNDGFVNVPALIYESLLFYMEHWRPRPISDQERIIIKPNGSALSSGELGIICKRAFNESFPNKEFTFSRFRMHCQTVFSNVCTDPLQMKWFNQMMCHR